MAVAGPAIAAGIGAVVAGAAPYVIWQTILVNLVLTGFSHIDDDGNIWTLDA